MIRTFWHVALPAARPAAAMLSLFTFVASWTNFFWPFVVLGSTNPTLPVALQLLQATYFKDMSLIMAGVVWPRCRCSSCSSSPARSWCPASCRERSRDDRGARAPGRIRPASCPDRAARAPTREGPGWEGSAVTTHSRSVPVRPNLEDVAAHAGVSRATVSRVVNGQSTVAEDLRKRVVRSIDKLGYVPNQAARKLMSKRSETLALVASEPDTRVFGDPFFGGIVRGMSREANRAGLQLVLLMAQDFDDLERVKRFLKASPVDGAMLISSHADDGLTEELQRLATPYVIGGRPIDPTWEPPMSTTRTSWGPRSPRVTSSRRGAEPSQP